MKTRRPTLPDIPVRTVRLNGCAIDRIQNRHHNHYTKGYHLVLYAEPKVKKYKAFKAALKDRLSPAAVDFFPRQRQPMYHSKIFQRKFKQQAGSQFLFANCFVSPPNEEKPVTMLTAVGLPKDEAERTLFLRSLKMAAKMLRLDHVEVIVVDFYASDGAQGHKDKNTVNDKEKKENDSNESQEEKLKKLDAAEDSFSSCNSSSGVDSPSDTSADSGLLYKKQEADRNEHEETKRELMDAQKELQEAKRELDQTKEELAETKRRMEEAEAQLKNVREILDVDGTFGIL